MTLRLVIFDMDGVLNAYDLDIRLDDLARLSGLTPEEVHARIWQSGFEDDADAGLYPNGQAYLDEFSRRLGVPVNREQWVAARKAAMRPNAAVLDLARRVRAAAQIAILTNNGPLTEETLEAMFPQAAALFAGAIFMSWRFKAKKPERTVYRAVCERMGVKPQAALMIDDKAENVEGAIAAGLSGHHFTDAGHLEAELARFGVLQ